MTRCLYKKRVSEDEFSFDKCRYEIKFLTLETAEDEKKIKVLNNYIFIKTG